MFFRWKMKSKQFSGATNNQSTESQVKLFYQKCRVSARVSNMRIQDEIIRPEKDENEKITENCKINNKQIGEMTTQIINIPTKEWYIYSANESK